jgi:hypothetical protein
MDLRQFIAEARARNEKRKRQMRESAKRRHQGLPRLGRGWEPMVKLWTTNKERASPD